MAEYTTREMVEAIELAPPVRNFLTRTFFPRERTHVAEKIEVDVKKGKRVMAPFVSPRIGGKVITRQGFQTNEFTTPRIAPERVMTIDDISKRTLGENVYSKKTPSEREDELLVDGLTPLDHNPKAFAAVMPNGHGGIFERTGKKGRNGKELFEQRFGPSVPHMIKKQEVIATIRDKAESTLHKRIDAEINYILSKGAAKNDGA